MTSWFWAAHPRVAPRIRLFCFPYAVAGANVYRGWASRVPPDVEVVALQLPGRGPRLREPAVDRLEPLLQALRGAFLPYQGVPFVFFGHSMGAVLAFEFCRWLRRHGDAAPVHLILSGCEPPPPESDSPPPRRLSDTDLIAWMRSMGGTPEGVLDNAEYMQLVLPALRADLALVDAWRPMPEAPLDIPVTIMGARDDTLVPASVLEGWRDHTRSAYACHLFSGGHMFIRTEEASVLELICSVLVSGR
ncbi:thioesterase II family protein [Polyangium fumosum]|uniref:Thioesterase n=1 Tax=Polyangium fumosum TaxID=889272 RepID=A0A4U1IVZ8_9BACT|nr:alpha/beta fold hydrolase [Polyangium fumosum]TKC98580.1 thioesterase [Polyangium fumosum]